MHPIHSVSLFARAGLLLISASCLFALEAEPAFTKVEIAGEDFHINHAVTYPGRTWQGQRIEGLLLNSRMVQATFDDLNPQTASRWAYPDTGRWDADRNTWEFMCAMSSWRRAGLLAITLNLQGGAPVRFPGVQPWENSAFAPDGSLRPAYFERLARVIKAADRNGLVVILGYFYFGQDQRLTDEAAVIRATDAATAWVHDHGYRNVIIEIANETDYNYDHAILGPKRIDELITRVKSQKPHGRALLTGASFSGGTIPTANVARVSDFLLIHGNSVNNPADLVTLIRQTRAVEGAANKPVVINEDDHFDFDAPASNFTAAISEHVSWGYFDARGNGEPAAEGFQSLPVEWRLLGSRKVAFFTKLAEITGSPAPISPAKPGDANGDGVVDNADLTIVKAQLGRHDDEVIDHRADLDRNRRVDAADVDLVVSNLSKP